MLDRFGMVWKYGPHLAYGIIGIFVFDHLGHLALGMLPLDAQWGGGRLSVWSSGPGQGVLWAALGGHFVWMLWRFYALISRPFYWKEGVLIGCGLAIPFLLIPRVITLGLGVNESNYAYTLSLFWITDLRMSLIHILGFVVVWIGIAQDLYAFIRVHPRWIPFKPWIGLLCVIVPTLAFAGFISAITHLDLSANPQLFLDEIGYSLGRLEQIEQNAFYVRVVLLTGILGVVLSRVVWLIWQHRYRLPRVSYKDLKQFDILPGSTLLAAIKLANIPHASVCGGNGRCSTCRVRISEGLTSLPSPAVVESRILQRIKAPTNVRLACQIRPTADLKVTPLLAPTVSAQEGLQSSSYLQGEEREVAILFGDLRGFTHFTEAQLPYDVVFILNQYCTEMGQAVTLAGGHLDKFIGDGVMALFGIESGPEIGCKQALTAAVNMLKGLESINQSLEAEISEPLRMGIGIHTGVAIIGEMGYGTAKNVTAIGDAVNLASRLEALTKEYKSEILISQDVSRYAGVDFSHLPYAQTTIRGKREKITIIPISGPELTKILAPLTPS